MTLECICFKYVCSLQTKRTSELKFSSVSQLWSVFFLLLCFADIFTDILEEVFINLVLKSDFGGVCLLSLFSLYRKDLHRHNGFASINTETIVKVFLSCTMRLKKFHQHFLLSLDRSAAPSGCVLAFPSSVFP